MNQELTRQITQHIITNLGVFGSSKNTIFNLQFETSKKIDWKDEKERDESSSLYACQVSLNNVKLKIAAAQLSCGHSDHAREQMAFIVQLENCPMYGCYADRNEMEHSIYNAFIGCQIQSDNWIPTTIYIQATFLAGMEQLRELSSPFEKIDNQETLDTLLKDMKAFINYRNSSYDEDEEDYAGQEG